VREPPQAPLAPSPGGGRPPSVVQAVLAALRDDAAFRRYLLSRGFVAVASMAQAFFAVHARRELGASDGDVALYSALLLGAQTASTLLWGAVADRLHQPPVLLGGTLLYAAATTLAFVAASPGWFALVFVLAGLWLGALAVTDPGFPLALAEARNANRALYVAAANTVLSPIYVIAPLVGGAAADAAGYRATYAIALAAALLACVLAARLRGAYSAGVTHRLDTAST
jgi:MFS family permease